MPRYTIVVLLLVLAVGALVLLRHAPTSAPPTPAPAAAGFPLTLTDALKRTVTVPHKPTRIVSIAPSTTEILFALGVGNRVVADTTYCDYPAAASKLPKIGGYSNPDLEKLLGYTPDLVLGARGNPAEIYPQLDTANIPAVSIDAVTLRDMLASIRTIGRLVGEVKAAETLIADLEARQKAVEQVTAGLPAKERPRVLFLFTPDNLYSAGKGSFIDELITLGGGANIAAKTNTPWPELSMETVLADDPQVIIVLAFSMGDAKQPLTSAKALQAFRKQARWRSVAAVKAGRVYAVDDDTMTLPGPRLIDGLEAMAKALHPDRFSKGAP